MTSNRPYFVGSLTSGVDGSSEGGRLSTMRLPSALVLYSVPLLQAIRRSGYRGKVNAEPALVDGVWVLKVTYEGDRPPEVPERWHGHRVILEELKPADA
ncbi:MAG TPA: hypothetical protein VGO86_17890 [Candidatus Dormibacteraeota bacterium]